MKKNSILIIIGVTIVAVGVIIAVIIASVSNSGDGESSSDSEKPHFSSNLPYDSSVVTPSDNSKNPSTSVSEPTSDTPSVVAEGIVATANSLIGVPFAENGADTNGFDNSGFIYYVLRENGYITCPRTTHEQSKMGARLEYSQLKIGDLAFFSDEGMFGGIYIGNGKMIGCLMPGQSVRIIDITTSYYKSNFYCGVSLS